VTITTRDGWTLIGELTRGAPTHPVLLVHQLSSSRREWTPLLQRLHNDPPLTTLAIDLRGHGESTQGPDGATRWESFGIDSSRWAGIVRDVDAAVRYLHEQFPEMRGVIAVGSSIGSTAVLREGADDPSVMAVGLLSPGLDYRGLDTVVPLTHFIAMHRPVLAIAAEGDTASAEAVRRFDSIANPPAPSPAAPGTMDGGAGPANVPEAGAASTGDGGRASLLTSTIFSGTGAHGVSIGAAGVHPEMWAQLEGWIRNLATRPGYERSGAVVPGEPSP
jgi:pimeloyl-ACP methyl ester carboxylesterase